MSPYQSDALTTWLLVDRSSARCGLYDLLCAADDQLPIMGSNHDIDLQRVAYCHCTNRKSGTLWVPSFPPRFRSSSSGSKDRRHSQ
jgi:hypothetical protein